MITAHQLAAMLLDLPDYPVVVSVDDQHGLTSPIENPFRCLTRPWDKDDQFGRMHEDEPGLGDKPVVVICPEEYA